MTNIQYKTTSIVGLGVEPPSTVALRPNTIMTHAAQRAVGAAQDKVCGGSRRVLGTWGLSGGTGFHTPDTGVQAVGVQTHPDRDTWRSGGSIFCNRLTPGCFARARIYFCPSGSSAYEDPPGTWNPGGPHGAVRLSHDWDSGTSGNGPHTIDIVLEASELADAAIPTDTAQLWHQLRYVETGPLRPNVVDTEALAVEWIEDVELELEIFLQGCTRIVQVVVFEEPLRSSYEHDDDGPHAINGQNTYEVPQSLVPVIEAIDGATYDENRFGTYRMIHTAERQQRAVGPVLFSLVAWSEGTQDDTIDVTPLSTSSTSFVDAIDGTSTTYDRNRYGWICAASYAQVHKLSDAGLVFPGGAADVLPTRAVVPGMVVIEARLTGGATTGTVRIQSGTYEWIDIEVTSGSWSILEASGLFETQVAADHSWATIQVFFMVDAGTIELRAASAAFGE